MSKLLRFMTQNRLEAGVDEVARGCLAGPVVQLTVGSRYLWVVVRR